MPTLRTKSISTKVTDEEYVQFEALAGEQTISEWARNVLLKATKLDASEHAVLAEILALRTILLNIHFAVSQGQTLDAVEMQKLIARADQDKLAKRESVLRMQRGICHETKVGSRGERRQLAEQQVGVDNFGILPCRAQRHRNRLLPQRTGVDSTPTALPGDLHRDTNSGSDTQASLLHTFDGSDAKRQSACYRSRCSGGNNRNREEYLRADR